MVTLNKIDNSNRSILQITGLSTDEKPLQKIEGEYITNGSIFKEIDTSDTYKFDYENKVWYKQ